ncbi:MAG: VCBS repeat-containing protein, partial [Gammaproteobacteria bacterium]|nr:VCBS repeat-containing protein [Gammaproteobacteria bacterium]
MTLAGGLEDSDIINVNGTAITGLTTTSATGAALASGGTYDYDHTTGVLTINFAGSTTAAAAETILEAITYGIDAADQDPSTTARTVTLNTVTDNGGGADTNADISETATISVSAVNDAPVFSNLDGAPTFTEDGVSVVLDADVVIADTNLDALNSSNGDYDGASVTLGRNGGVSTDDVFSFNDGNGITLETSTSLNKTVLQKSGVTIAIFDTTTIPGELRVTFTNANGETPTSADVDYILRQITYANSSDAPPATAQIDWTFDDGNTGGQGTGGALQALGSTTVTITAVNDAPNFDTASFTTHTITTGADGASSTVAIDIDGDGDLDVLSADQNTDQIAWYENDGSGSFIATHVVSTNADAVISVTAADVDGDGDMDILSASFSDNKVAWYENDGAENFTEHTITTGANGALMVTTVDMDGDGDMDVLSASQTDDTVAWYENDGSQN